MDLEQPITKNSLKKKYQALCEDHQKDCRSMVINCIVSNQTHQRLHQTTTNLMTPEHLNAINRFEDVDSCFNILEQYTYLELVNSSIGLMSRCKKCHKKPSVWKKLLQL